MDKEKIKHMLLLKSTWIVILSNIGLILNTSDVLNIEQLEKYKVITNCLIIIAETLGLISIYKTEPLNTNNSNKLE
jgi:hypothetical protein